MSTSELNSKPTLTDRFAPITPVVNLDRNERSPQRQIIFRVFHFSRQVSRQWSSGLQSRFLEELSCQSAESKGDEDLFANRINLFFFVNGSIAVALCEVAISNGFRIDQFQSPLVL